MSKYNPDLRVQLRDEFSTPDPDGAATVAARGDKLNESVIDMTVEEALEGTTKDQQEFMKSLVRAGHWGPFEHPKAFFAVEGLSYVAHVYLVRHRHMSFDVQSQRYVNVQDATVVIPKRIRENERLRERAESIVDECKDFYGDACETIEKDVGDPYEDARYFLPQGIRINLTFSANPRSLMHFLDLRLNQKAHPEARQFAGDVSAIFEDWAPMSYNAYDLTNNNSLRAP